MNLLMGFDAEVTRMQEKLPNYIPLDGVVVTALVFFLSPNETRIRNALVVGGAHFVLHNAVARGQYLKKQMTHEEYSAPGYHPGDPKLKDKLYNKPGLNGSELTRYIFRKP